MPKTLRHHAHHLDKRLRFRLRLYFIISAILVIILIANVLRGALRLEFGLTAFLIGIGVGVLSSRMFRASWNKDTKKVVTRLDTFGVVILVLYIVLEVFREKIVGYFTHGIQVGTVGLAVLAGVMLGRVLGTRGRIMEVLRDQKVFK